MMEIIDTQTPCGYPQCENIAKAWIIFVTGEAIQTCRQHDTGNKEVLARFLYWAKLRSRAVDVETREI